MHSYSAYGVIFDSEIPLPELIEAAGEHLAAASMRAQIRVGKVDRTRPPGVEASSRFWATPREVFAEYPGTCAFLIENGCQVTIDPQRQIDPRIIRLYLL